MIFAGFSAAGFFAAGFFASEPLPVFGFVVVLAGLITGISLFAVVLGFSAVAEVFALLTRRVDFVSTGASVAVFLRVREVAAGLAAGTAVAVSVFRARPAAGFAITGLFGVVFVRVTAFFSPGAACVFTTLTFFGFTASRGNPGCSA